MTKPDSTKRVGIESTFGDRGCEDLAEALRKKPRLTDDRSLFLDLVQADYHRLSESGEPWEPEAYCKYLGLSEPALLASVRRLVEVEKHFVENPSLLDEVGKPAWPMPDEVFQGFLLLEELGRGAASRVFLARERRLGNRKVALKVTTLETSEADLLGRADRRGVVPIYSTGSDKDRGLHWICMPFLGRRTLQEEIEAGSGGGIAGVNRLTSIGSQLAGTLAELADLGICHGDLKPSNVLLLDGDQPTLIDFNLSQTDTAQSVLIGGTLPYMAPEVLRRVVASSRVESDVAADSAIAADVFSLGCLLFQMSTGRYWVQPDHGAATPEGVALSLLDAQLDAKDSLRASLSDVPEGFANLIQSCLALNPLERPPTFGEIEHTLLQLAKASRRRSWGRRIGIVTLACVAATAGVVWRVNSISDEQTIRQAVSLLDDGKLAQATVLLANTTDDPQLAIDTRTALGKSLLAIGRRSEAADLFAAVGEATDDPQAFALAGYATHRVGSHKRAIAQDRIAIKLGSRSVAVYNNLAAGLIHELVSHSSLRASAEIESLLLEAAEQDPACETVCVNILQHVEVLAQRGAPHGYPLADLIRGVGPTEDLDILVRGCRQLANLGPSHESPPAIGLDLLRRLASRVPPDSLAKVIGTDQFARYAAMPGFSLPSFDKRIPYSQVLGESRSFYLDPSLENRP